MTVASARAGDAVPGAARAPSAYGAPDGGTSLEPGRYAQGLRLPGRDVLAQTESLHAHQVTAHCEMLARTSSCLFRSDGDLRFAPNSGQANKWGVIGWNAGRLGVV